MKRNLFFVLALVSICVMPLYGQNPKTATTGTLNGHEWVDLGLPSGTLWATCNVDANKSEDYGGYFSWDEGNKSVANWGDCWCMPSKEQWEELMENTKSTWITKNSVNGRLFTADNGNSLFLPAAGLSNIFNDSGFCGYYWSGSLDTDSTNDAWSLLFVSDFCDMYVSSCYYGRSVRPVFPKK